MEKITDFTYAAPDGVKSAPASHETMRTLGSMVAILGATLGVNVGQALAVMPVAQPGEKPNAEFVKITAGQKQNANQLKIDSQQQKGVAANQLKLDSQQLKIDKAANK